jgi:hypothetical protein
VVYGFDRFITGRRATRGHPLTAAPKEANRLDCRERAANEHGFADLKGLAIAHHSPHERAARDQAAAGSPRTDERRGPPLTDDHPLPITPTTSTSIPASTHASPVTYNFKMTRAHWNHASMQT